MKNGLKMLQNLDYKALALALVVSANVNADFFGDVGDWVDHNRTVSAIVGVGALTAAAVVIRPISGLLSAGEEELAATKLLSGAEGAGVEAESLETAASRLKVDEGAEGGEIFKSFKGHKYIGNDKWVKVDLVKEGEGATGGEKISSFSKNVTRDDLLKSIDGYADEGYADWIAKNGEDIEETKL